MLSSLIYQFVTIVCGLITPRLILRSFGSTYNGVISSATQFLSMISFLTFGITASTRVALYSSLANNDILKTSRIVKSTELYMRKVAGAVIIFAILLCIIYPHISHNDLSNLQNVLLISIISVGTFAEYFFGITNTTLVTADQSSYIANTLNILKTILNTICVAILINFRASIYCVKLVSSLVFLLSPFALSVYVKKKYKLISDCEPDDSAIKQRGAVAFHSIANIIHNNTDIVILTLFTDAKLISVYTIYYLIVGKLKSLLQVFTSGMEAAFGDMWVKKETEQLNRNFRIYEYMLYSFTAVVFSCVAVLILPFIAVYTRGVTDINYIRPELAILITFAEGMYCIRQPYLTLVYATGSFEETKIGAMIEAILNIIISILLVQTLGIAGVIIGTLIANIFRTVQFSLYVSKRILQRNIQEVMLRFLWVLLNGVIVVSCYLGIIFLIDFSDTWVAWLIQAFTVGIISIVALVLTSLVFYKQDFRTLMSKGRNSVKYKVRKF